MIINYEVELAFKKKRLWNHLFTINLNQSFNEGIVTVMKVCLNLDRMGNYAGSIAKSTIHSKKAHNASQIETKVDLRPQRDRFNRGYFLASGV